MALKTIVILFYTAGDNVRRDELGLEQIMISERIKAFEMYLPTMPQPDDRTSPFRLLPSMADPRKTVLDVLLEHEVAGLTYKRLPEGRKELAYWAKIDAACNDTGLTRKQVESWLKRQRWPPNIPYQPRPHILPPKFNDVPLVDGKAQRQEQERRARQPRQLEQQQAMDGVEGIATAGRAPSHAKPASSRRPRSSAHTDTQKEASGRKRGRTG
jgi:hypothetical protein